MNLTFLGGADEVGASSTLISISGKQILVDAGIRISPRTNRGIQNDQLPDLRPISEAGGPDYILVTHAHTDHTGALPLIVEQYPHVPVLATRPTVDLVRILQADAQRIMQSRQEQEGELPLFDEIAAERLVNAFQPVEFRQPVRLGDSLQVTFHPAGHIAGAAMLVLESDTGTLVMSGDVSLSDQRAVVKAVVPNVKADALVLESTYGGKLHANRVAEEKRLIETLRQVVARGGKALIPAFALGRAQEVLQIILAYRDQLDVPVYADGMVRAVCRAYAGFADWLPSRTARAAGDNPLFFRDNVMPVRSAAHREEIARAEGPAVIVASSGMLTGGASVMYAAALAGDAHNAIFLTGYQDEEAPGRFLQRIMRQHEAGDSVTLRLNDQAVALRCQLGTYSLSAHADESELASVADVLEVDDVMLVHGDPGARHSLATNLRQRGRRVQTPKIGQTITFAFAPRPWAMGQVSSGHESRSLDTRELWEALKQQAGNFYSAGELARMWWGDTTRAEEVITVMTADELYFAADWRRRDTFCVRTPEQVARTQRQRAIMLAHPDIVGQLVVLRDSNNRPRVGVVVNAEAEKFEANVYGAKGRHYPADALLWAIAPWREFPADTDGKLRIGSALRQAQELQDTILPFARRQKLVSQAEPVIPEKLLPSLLPTGVTREIATLAAVLALARDGAVLGQNGLVPQRAQQGEPMEMNQARQAALAALPPEANVRKVGLENNRYRMTLFFDFPETAIRHYAEEIERIVDLTGWEVTVNPQVNQLALGTAAYDLLPSGVNIVKGPSFYIDQRQVHVEVNCEGDFAEVERAYQEQTGFRLVIRQPGDTKNGPDQNQTARVDPVSAQNQMEINAAYGVIRQVLEPYGLYKTSLKQGQIVLAFISPQVGERHQDTITALANETGYTIMIHPHPNQQQIIQVVQQVVRDAGWQIRKGPSIHIDRGEVAVTLADDVAETAVDPVAQQIEERTGYRFVIN
jgi:Cft2 family RNA processing exonuclease